MKESMLGNGPYGGRLARVGGHRCVRGERAHARGEARRVALEDEQCDLVEHRLHRRGVARLALGQHDLLGGCRLGPLVGVEQVLVKLLPRAPSHLLERDVDVRSQTGQLDHVPRELLDRHRLAHLEHDPLPALAERAGADHELDRLRDRHEVARHPLVGERERTAERDLAAEDRHDGAGRAEHVAETHGRELRLRPLLLGRLDRVLGERLRRAHDRRRLHRLVGRDEHEPRDAASPATRAIRRVASALLRTASTGLSSISATCLYAAAWKTTDGRCCAKTSRMRSPSLQSARTAASTDGWTCRSSSSSRWMRNRFSSAWSMRTSRRGATRAIWRQSSDPIDPPAPVTRTVSPLRYAPMRSSSIRTGSRPRMSSTCTSRTWRTIVPGPDCSSSKTVGSVRTGMPRRRPSRTTRARSVPGADGIAIVSSSGSASSRMRPRSSVVPSTRTPSTRIPRLSGSSSTKPTGSMSSCGLRSISRSTSRPPSPAPTISTRRAPARGRIPRSGPSYAIRATNRAPPTSASVSRKNSASTPVGAVTATSPVRDGTVTGCTIAMKPASTSVLTATASTTAM